MPLPGVEVGIAASVVVLGVMLALAARPPIWVAAVIVGAFAIFHGYAHAGAELPEAANPIAYGLGFVIATGLAAPDQHRDRPDHPLAGRPAGVARRWRRDRRDRALAADRDDGRLSGHAPRERGTAARVEL